MSYLNVNSITNKFNYIELLLAKNVNVLYVSETKIDSSFPDSQFMINGFKIPYRLDFTSRSGGLLLYVSEDIPSRQLDRITIPFDIQLIPIELNFRNRKWLYIGIYRPPLLSLNYFLDHLSNVLDKYAIDYENIVLMGDFNASSAELDKNSFLSNYDFSSLIKSPTCYKSIEGSCIDLILTNRKNYFQKCSTFETGISDHHLLIYTMLKSTYEKLPPKKQKYRSFKKFSPENYETRLHQKLLSNKLGIFGELNSSITSVLDDIAPIKTRVIRGNNKPYVNKHLRKAIIKRSRLKNKANTSKSKLDYVAYKKQRNFVVNLNKKCKKAFFAKISTDSTRNSMWKFCKSVFPSLIKQ